MSPALAGRFSTAVLTGKPLSFFFFFFFLIILVYLFIFGCAESLLLCWLFYSYSEWGLLFTALHRLLVSVASSVAELGLQGTELQ